MDLTPERKRYIDSLRYESLLSRWRFTPGGNPWFQGETGEYWLKRMKELKSRPGGLDMHIKASKLIGWEK